MASLFSTQPFPAIVYTRILTVFRVFRVNHVVRSPSDIIVTAAGFLFCSLVISCTVPYEYRHFDLSRVHLRVLSLEALLDLQLVIRIISVRFKEGLQSWLGGVPDY